MGLDRKRASQVSVANVLQAQRLTADSGFGYFFNGQAFAIRARITYENSDTFAFTSSNSCQAKSHALLK